MSIVAVKHSGWFGAERASAWARVMLVMSALMVIGLMVATRVGTAADPWGRPLAPDFSSFWVAGRMALSGAAWAAWDPVAHGLAERASFPVEAGFHDDYYAFFYPPPFLLLMLPFSLLPYGFAALAWIASTSAAYLASLRRLFPAAGLAALAFPALLVNVEHGQNGALTAALLASGAGLLDRRPRLAGACLGMLCIKPHLALLVVPALLAAGRLSTLACAALSAGVLSLVSWLVLGGDAWRAFLIHSPFALMALEGGLIGHAKMASSFAGARLLGLGVTTAWLIQGMTFLIALATVVSVSRRKPGGVPEIATVCAAACLATPFLLDYDLVIMAIPLSWVLCHASRTGFRRWEKALLFAGFAMPLVARPIGIQLGVPIAPIILLGLLWLIVDRLQTDDATAPAQA